MLAPNPQHHVTQPRLSLFGAPPWDRRGVPVFPSLRRGKTRGRSPLSRSDCRSNSSRSRGAPASKTRTTVHRDGRVFHRSAEPTTHAAGQVLPFAVPFAGKRVVLSGKTWAYRPGPTARSDDLAPLHAGGRAEIFERLGAPSCLKRLLTKAGRRGAGRDRPPEAETVPEAPAPFRSTGFLRPDGDEEACQASSGTVSSADGTRLKTLNAETGKATAQLAAAVARKVRPDDSRCRRCRTRQLNVSREVPARRTGSRFLSCTLLRDRSKL